MFRNNIDVFIDDHVGFCEGVSKTKTKVLMFDSPYNKQETKYKRVYSWDEIYEEINTSTRKNAVSNLTPQKEIGIHGFNNN